MINKWLVRNPPAGCRRKGCIIAIPGRAMTIETMEKVLDYMEVDKSLQIILQPKNLEWYPAPNGVSDQEEAVFGSKVALIVLQKKLKHIQRSFRLKRSQIVLFGYSAGAVMTLKLCASSFDNFAAAVCLSGAILDTPSFPNAKNQTPILLRHKKDDLCFSWEERYLPMKRTLNEREYNMFVSESSAGGHAIDGEDLFFCARFIKQHLNYSYVKHK